MWLEWDGKNAKTPAAQGWFAKNREAAGIVSRQSAPCVLLCALLWDSLEPQSGLLCCWLWSAASRPPNGRCRHGHVDLIYFATQLYHSACRAAVLLCYLVACRMVFLPGFDALPATYPPPARRLSPQSGMSWRGLRRHQAGMATQRGLPPARLGMASTAMRCSNTASSARCVAAACVAPL